MPKTTGAHSMRTKLPRPIIPEKNSINSSRDHGIIISGETMMALILEISSFGSNTSACYQQNFEIPFFNYFLKGIGDVSKIAEANIFITGSNEWRQYDTWPPSGKEDKAIYLRADGRLDWTQTKRQDGFSEYLSDPAKPVPYTEDVHFNRTREFMTDDQRFAGRRPDVLSFKTDILNDDVTVTGLVTADLAVSISTTDADFVVKLIDVFPDELSYNKVDIYSDKDPVEIYPMGGYEMLVHGEIMRGRYRNSFENPEPFVPGKIERVKFRSRRCGSYLQKGPQDNGADSEQLVPARRPESTEVCEYLRSEGK